MFVGEILQTPGTVTTPTTTVDSTSKIKPSSAANLTPTDPIVDIRNDGQHTGGLKPHSSAAYREGQT